MAENIATTSGMGCLNAPPLINPYSSGAPAIFIDQFGRLCGSAAIIGAVGEDDFGRMNLDRLQRDVVDISGMLIQHNLPTGTAFIHYHNDGDRDFVFNLWSSAAGQLTWTSEIAAVVNRTGHLYAIGTILAQPKIWQIIERAAAVIQARGGTVSLDPDLRKELKTNSETGTRFAKMVSMSDMLLPSGNELYLAAGLTTAAGETSALEKTISTGLTKIILKRGTQGSSCFQSDGAKVRASAFKIDEVDPTGAGDCFGGAYLTCRRLGLTLNQALTYANAAGARTATVTGPIEGVGNLAELDQFICLYGASYLMPMSVCDLVPQYQNDTLTGITSICSEPPLVLSAALQHGHKTGATVLIEATCNQANHLGGYTGLEPSNFAALVTELARLEHCPATQTILVGDHLGPNPWYEQPIKDAMHEAKKKMAAYVKTGFRKIYLDASMECKNEPDTLNDKTTALRAEQLARVAEETAKTNHIKPPLYVIGTEVPPPSGADHQLTSIVPTTTKDVQHTLAVHQKVFEENDLSEAFLRVVGLVVQPGVKFGNENVINYDRTKARDLTGLLTTHKIITFEAYSTDYQSHQSLRSLVHDGFAILKVGPELTFMLREVLYGLDLIASEFLSTYGDRRLNHTVKRAMQAQPHNWASQYNGSEKNKRLLKHNSLSDRVRYYWHNGTVTAAVSQLFDSLRGHLISRTLVWQFLPGAAIFCDAPLKPEDIAIRRITKSITAYHQACHTYPIDT